MPSRPHLDTWSSLAHYVLVANASNDPLHSWVHVDDRRRINAYYVLDAIRKNNARHLLNTRSEKVRRAHREYGIAATLNDRIRDGVLGEDWDIVVPGADDDLPDAPLLPDPPRDLPEGASPQEERIHSIQQGRWDAEADALIDAWEAEVLAQPALRERQDQLREWADRQLLRARIVEAEDDAGGLGDTVYVLWPREGDWPEVRVYEPDGYFPILTEANGGSYPTKVHLAWEYRERDANGKEHRYLHRLTFELVDLLGERFDVETGAIVLQPGDVGTRDGRVGRRLPWHEDGEPVSTVTCVFTDGVWDLDGATPGLSSVPDLSEEAALGGVRRIDLGCDFLPVVHVPNTPASRTHFGTANLSLAAQLLDDLGLVDSDLMKTARLVAGPAIGLSGAQAKDQQIKPLTIFNLGDNGRMDVLDLSQGLDRMMQFGDRLFDRALLVTRIPKTLVGRVTAAEAPSGVAMLVEVAPYASLIGVLRMAREPKYRLLLKFAQRLAQLQGPDVLPPGPTPEAMLAFGSFLPMDRAALVADVASAVQGGFMSRLTAVSVLIAGGFPIEDARREMEQIQAEDFDGAVKIADATGVERLAAEYLGLELPEDEEGSPEGGETEPTVELPPVPPVPGEEGGTPPEPEET